MEAVDLRLAPGLSTYLYEILTGSEAEDRARAEGEITILTAQDWGV